MGRRHKSTSSVSTMQILGMILVLLTAIIVMAYLLSPDKDPAPPTSTVNYEPRPVSPSPPEPLLPTPEPQPEEAEEVPAEAIPVVEQGDYTLSGTVVDEETGKPIRHCTVFISRNLSEEEQERLAAREKAAIAEQEADEFSVILEERTKLTEKQSTDTNKQGRFQFQLNVKGNYTINVRNNEYMRFNDQYELFGDRNTETIEIQLSKGASIEGHITEMGSTKGATDLRVDSTGSENFAHNYATSDQEGYYKITGLAPGEYDVSVQLSNTAYSVGDTIPFKKVAITSPTEHVKGIDFEVKAAGVVWGYVVTPENVAIKGADLVLCSSASILSQATKALINQAPPIHDGSDGNGYYELVGVPLNQEWRVYATSEQHSPQLADPFILTETMREARVDIYLFNGTTVYGRVVTSGGDPVVKAEVLCIPELMTFTRPLDTPPAFREANTDDEGYFEIPQLPAGNYQIRAHKETYKLALQGLPIYANGYNDIHNLRVVLDPVSEGEYTVFGIVLDSTGVPIQGASVELGGLGTESFMEVNLNTTTDQEGRFLFTGIELGMYMLHAEADGYGIATLSRVLLDKENEVTLKATAVIRGRVLAKDTRQAPGKQASVNAVSIFQGEDGSSLNLMDLARGGAHAMADPQTGRFDLVVKDGAYRLEAKAPGFTRGRTEVSLEAGEVLDNVEIFLLSGGGVIGGQVVTSDGKSPQGTEVILVEDANAAIATVMLAAEQQSSHLVRVGQDGRFLFEDLPEGTYTIYAKHPNYASADSGPIALSAEGYISNIVLRLGSGGTLEGFVFDDGVAQSGAIVMVLGNGITKTETTDSSGYYSIDELSPGLYQAMVVPIGEGGIPGLSSGMQGVQVEIQEGMVTPHNFGVTTGIRLSGVCTPGPQTMLGGMVVLRTPGMLPGLGQIVDTTQLMGTTMHIDQSGAFRLDDVPPGTWQMDVYYLEPPMNPRYVHTEMVTVSMDDPDAYVTLNVTYQ